MTPIDPMMDAALDTALHQRRAALAPKPAPSARLDYVVHMEKAIDGGRDGRLVLQFVPDKHTLDPEALADYLNHLDTADGEAETLTVTILEDMVNELVCRWARVSVTFAGKTVTMEDRQPGWHNDGLLARV